MQPDAERGRETETLRCLLAILRTETKQIRLRQSLDRKYDPDQPRAPAGQSDGGRWIPTTRTLQGGRSIEDNAISPDGTAIRSIYNHDDPLLEWDERHTVLGVNGSSTVFETRGDTQTIRDGRTGDIIGRSTWTAGGPQQDGIIALTFLRPPLPLGPGLAPPPQSPLDNATKLYEYLLGKEGPGQKAVLGFTAREYQPNGTTITTMPMVTWVGMRSKDDIEMACPRYPEIQARTDMAVATIKMLGNYPSPSVFGTRVHRHLQLQIDSLNDPTFIAEVSLLKSGAAAVYGELNSVRIDAYESVKRTTACVYDPKTGKAILTPARSLEIADHVAANFGAVRQILVIEIKPSE